jgi:V-type H+-transporting ATPase subunit C
MAKIQLPEKLYWLVALPGGESVFDEASKKVKPSCSEIVTLDCPADLTFKSFDSLVKLLDDLAKYDAQVESVLRRVEKMMYDFPLPEGMDHPDFIIISSHRTNGEKPELFKMRTYLTKDFKWDASKYLKTNTIAETTNYIMSSLAKADDAVRTKMSALSEQKSALAAVAKKDGSLAVRDLIDVITPDLVKESEWFETEHLTTVAVIVPRGTDKEFLSSYHTFSDNVVPECAMKLDVADKDGNALYRVVLFKKNLDDFKSGARASPAKFVVREFSFSPQKYQEYDAKRKKMVADLEKNEALCREVCRAGFSDTFVSWMHLKVMRIFVEGVLRFGLSETGKPKFSTFMLAPMPSANAQKEIQKALTTLAEPFVGADKSKDTAEDEEYLPYVQLPLLPLSSAD